MHLLPTNLAPLACIAGDSSARFGTSGIQLEANGKEFTAVATDGKRLVVVNGEFVSASHSVDGKMVEREYPHLDALASAPNGEKSALIPATDWKKVMMESSRLTKRTSNPILRSLPVVMGKNVSTFAATDMDRTMFHQPRNIEGRFPAWRQVIPAEKDLAYRINVDPLLLAETLETIAKLNEGSGLKAVTLAFNRSNEKPFTITAHGGESKIQAVVVPLSMDKKNKATGLDDERTNKEQAAALENASRTIETLTHDRDLWKKTANGLASDIEALESVIVQHKEEIEQAAADYADAEKAAEEASMETQGEYARAERYLAALNAIRAELKTLPNLSGIASKIDAIAALAQS